ncbi:MAG TPA: class I SAM-dependent methyltransferase [Acidimicrobiales bacterium]|nr:class I SAM-dependent methyltransferase [Acidimicrobiales bacterium]
MSGVQHPVFARAYARFAPGMEAAGVAEHRAELVAGLTGQVIEVGAGTGLNFAHYPSRVTHAVAVEPEPFLRARAEEAAAGAPVPVRVVPGTAEALPVPEASFDAAVVSLVLCSTLDPALALAELRRVLRPGGELRFYEHVRSSDPRAARLQRLADVVWPLLGGNCHTARHTEGSITEAGFEMVETRRFHFRPCLLSAPVAPHIIGTARRRP